MPSTPGDGLVISSTSNPRIKELVALRRRRHRDRSGVTLVEGYEELDLALRAGVRPQALYRCAEMSPADDLRVADRAANTGAPVFDVSRPAFDKVAYRESPDGWLAVVPEISTDLAALDAGTNPLFLVCETVEKPGNLGSILRTADAAGATAVISANPITDWGNPNVIRASKGTVFSVPVASGDSDDVQGWLGEHGITAVATTPDTDQLITELDLTGPTAILVGSEKYGLSDAWLAWANQRGRIPMFGQVDSLNVAVSAAIVTYEAVRQRGAPPRR